MKMKNRILLIGCGYMGIEYSKVLKKMNISFDVVGRGKSSVKNYEKILEKKVISRDLNKFLKSSKLNYQKAIICTDISQLSRICTSVIKSGIKDILLEKPGGSDIKELKNISSIASSYRSKVLIAYNRRFYSSIIKANEIIKKEGLISIHFDFTEIIKKIRKLKIEKKIKSKWVLGNSSHVIDTVFFLAGLPKNIKARTSGGLDWHKSASVFVGNGITKSGALFSYHANWNSPGRWGINLMTTKSKIILQPLEEIKIQKFKSFEVIRYNLNDTYDRNFKPGIYRMVKSFISENSIDLPTIDYHIQSTKVLYKIANY
jgi:predicted dehydrogenase